MPQRVEYDVFPNTRPEQLPGKLHAAFNLDGGLDGVGFKAYRSYLREQGLWDKSRVETIFSLVDVSWDREQVTFGSLARSIRESHEEDAIQDAIFARLRQENGLLVKYVFDALDVENGGRLHSDNELYRMITSYVYPGDFITLTSFQSWIHWMAGAGVLKVVGIRWALTERALEVLPAIRSMDVEEILEDLEEEAELAAASGPAPVSQAPEPRLPLPPTASPEPAATQDESGEDEEELPDMGLPPEAVPPSEADIALAEARFVENFGDVDLPEERSSLVSATPVASLSVPEPSGTLASRSDLTEIAAQLTLAWDDGAHWPSFTASQLGIEVSGSRPASEVLVELGVVALLLEGLAVQPQVFSFVAHLRSSDFFGALTSHGLGAALEALDLSDTPPAHQALAERLIHAHGVASRVAQEPELLSQLSAVETPSVAIAVIHDQLLGGTGKEACFWVLRELLRGGLLSERLTPCAVVPSRRLLEHAHRLGILPRVDLDTLEDLTVASSAVAASFGPESGYGEALEVMDRLTTLASTAP